MKRIAMCMMVILAGCTQQKPPEPARQPAAKVRSLPVQPRDMGTETSTVALSATVEPVALAMVATDDWGALRFPISLGGEYTTAGECFDDIASPKCVKFWAYIATSYETFADCMKFQSSEECPKRCAQLFDFDGDNLVTLSDFAAIEYRNQFTWHQMKGWSHDTE